MLSECTIFPELPGPYDVALRECVEAVFERYDVLAIVACGTVIRGTSDKRSDLDLHVLHRGNFRERVQLFFAGVPCEIFVNPPSKMKFYIEDQRKDRRPCSSHMFATGHIVYDPEGVAADVVERSRADLENEPPAPDEQSLVASRYGPATNFEDAEDLVERDPEAALLLLGSAVYGLVRCRLEAEPGWIPRQKDFLSELRKIDPESARLAETASSGELSSRFQSGQGPVHSGDRIGWLFRMVEPARGGRMISRPAPPKLGAHVVYSTGSHRSQGETANRPGSAFRPAIARSPFGGPRRPRWDHRA